MRIYGAEKFLNLMELFIFSQPSLSKTLYGSKPLSSFLVSTKNQSLELGYHKSQGLTFFDVVTCRYGSWFLGCFSWNNMVAFCCQEEEAY